MRPSARPSTFRLAAGRRLGPGAERGIGVARVSPACSAGEKATAGRGRGGLEGYTPCRFAAAGTAEFRGEAGIVAVFFRGGLASRLAWLSPACRAGLPGLARRGIMVLDGHEGRLPVSYRILASLLCAAALLAPVPAAADALSGAVRDEPLPRFHDRICPGVIGLKVDVAQAIVGRIRENAARVGLRLADEENCEPNVIASFVVDGQDYVRRLGKKQSWMFVDMSGEERRALFDGPGKVRAWTRTVVRTRDGMPVSRREGLMQIPETTMAMAHSKIYVATRRDLIAAMVLFDRDAIEHLSVFQLADYVTMRALAGTAFKDIPPAGGTILTLFENPAARAPAMTRYDHTFLETLYSSMANLPAANVLAMAQRQADEIAAE